MEEMDLLPHPRRPLVLFRGNPLATCCVDCNHEDSNDWAMSVQRKTERVPSSSSRTTAAVLAVNATHTTNPKVVMDGKTATEKSVPVLQGETSKSLAC